MPRIRALPNPQPTVGGQLYYRAGTVPLNATRGIETPPVGRIWQLQTFSYQYVAGDGAAAPFGAAAGVFLELRRNNQVLAKFQMAYKDNDGTIVNTDSQAQYFTPPVTIFSGDDLSLKWGPLPAGGVQLTYQLNVVEL